MLSLSRKNRESVILSFRDAAGEEKRIVISEIKNHRSQFLIEAPDSVKVLRAELELDASRKKKEKHAWLNGVRQL